MASGSFTGYTSNQYIRPKITWNSTKDVAGNKSTVTVTLSYTRTNTGFTTSGTGTFTLVINGTTYTFNNVKLSITNGSDAVAATKTVTIPHNSDGTKSITINATGSLTGTSLTYTKFEPVPVAVLDTIPRESLISAPSSCALGSACTLSVTRYSSSFAHTITYSVNGHTGTIVSGSSQTSISWTPAIATFAPYITGAVSATCTLYIKTYSGSTQIGSTKSTTMSLTVPASVKPTASIAVADAAGYYSTYGVYVQSKSRPRVTVTGAGAYGSTINLYSASLGSQGLSSPSSGVFTFAAVAQVGSVAIGATVKDSRQRTGSASGSITVASWGAPAISALRAYRCNSGGTAQEDGAYIKTVFSASISPLNNRNSAAYKLQYRENGGAWQTVTLSAYAGQYSVTNGSHIISAAKTSTFDIQIVATDDFTSTTRATSVDTVAVVMHWRHSKKGLGIGQYCTADNELQVGWDLRLKGDLVYDHIIAYGSGSGWRWEKYRSGKMIAWTAYESVLTGSTPTSVMGGYYSYASIYLPSGFAGVESAYAMARLGTGVGFGFTTNFNTSRVTVGAVGNANSNEIHAYLLIYGRWKQ